MGDFAMVLRQYDATTVPTTGLARKEREYEQEVRAGMLKSIRQTTMQPKIQLFNIGLCFRGSEIEIRNITKYGCVLREDERWVRLLTIRPQPSSTVC